MTKYYKNIDNDFFIFDINDSNQKTIENKIIELELEETTKDYIDEYSTQKTILNKEPEKLEIARLEAYLSSTDRIGRQISEKLLMGESRDVILDIFSDTFKKTYREVLIDSQEARDRINELRNIIN